MLGLKRFYRRLTGREEYQVQEATEPERLAAIPKTSCDVSALWTCDERKLAEIFNDEQVAADWAEDGVRLAAKGFTEMTHGVNPGDRRALYYLVRRTKPSSILEIGTHIGSSTLAITLAAARNRLDGVATTLLTADIKDVNDPQRRPWEQFGMAASPRALADSVGGGEFVRFEASPSLDVLARTDQRFGLIFLDGSHDADVVYREIPLALRRLEAPGIIVLHDYFPDERSLWPGQEPLPGPYRAVSRFIAEKAALRAVPLGDLPWPTKLGTHTTSLAVLARG